ncbi:MAG: aminopeptidase P family protein [Deltaproteobacteria bacterium]|nr:aminopeptidase P family protein [Deltaproteobacteria bacterium]
MTDRIKIMRAGLEGRGLDGILVTDLKNVRYLAGFTGTSGYVLLTSLKASHAGAAGFFFTDSRYALQARGEVKGLRITIYKKAIEEIAGTVKGLGLKRVGFDGRNLSYDTFRRLKKLLPAVRLKSSPDAVEGKRAVKDADEVEYIRGAIAAAGKGFESVEKRGIGGVTEKEVSIRIEAAVKKAGADALSFETIVASGFRSAMPHAVASGKRIKKGELVIVDMGVELGGYRSDETRTYAVGSATAAQKKIYSTVKDAQMRALDAIRPGARAKDVDGAARTCIRKAGYGKYFGHGTGHGVGLDVHERPHISPQSTDVFEEGMVVTVEPGIYIPGFGGVRIEDMALVTRDGAEVLTGEAGRLAGVAAGLRIIE